tara:strand:+ start:830 stop:1216 length:387 start_codon:yes stop_codon:yes gene_type:complete
MSSSKYRKWIDQVIKGLISLGLEEEPRSKGKYKIIKGTINGKPYRQKFSNTPRSTTKAMKDVLSETKRRLKKCNVDITNIRDEMPKLGFLTINSFKKDNQKSSFKELAIIFTKIEKELEILEISLENN